MRSLTVNLSRTPGRSAISRFAHVLLLLPALMPAQTPPTGPHAGSAEHWVATWATAQPLDATNAAGPPRPPQQPGNGAAQGGGQLNGAAQGGGQLNGRGPGAPGSSGQQGRGRAPQLNPPATVTNQTVRMVAHTSIGGSRVRVEFSNAMQGAAVTLGPAHIAIRDKESAIVPGTDRILTFDGKPTCVLRPGVLIYSDALNLDFPAMTDLAVSVYVPGDSGPPTYHGVGLHTGYVSPGDTTAQVLMPEPTLTRAYLWLTAIDVMAPPDASAIVAFGDSITDGNGTTNDGNANWPSVLARRLAANKATAHIAVVNSGISGNQVLRTFYGESALARFDRDVLSRAGVKWVVLLEGINDMTIHGQNAADPLTAEDMIAGYRLLISRAHDRGIKVMGATVTPTERTLAGSGQVEQIRTAVNQWIRTGKAFDAVADFEAAVRDPDQPTHLKAEYDSGDHLHPSDAGDQAMANSVNLSVFTK